MQSMTIKEIADACKGRIVGEESLARVRISGISIDSRKVGKGELFDPK